MKLIAFDLEACNRYIPGSIFSIGVVESDFDFNIYNKYDIQINPEAKFATKFRKPIDFDVDKVKLKTISNFNEQYRELTDLFNQDAIFLAHSVSNDVRMLCKACLRYKLPSFKFRFICSQVLYSIFANCSDGIGLDRGAEIIGQEFTHHIAEEDANMSLEIVKYICEFKNTSLSELIDEYGIKYGKLENFNIQLMKSELLNTQKEFRKQQRLLAKQNLLEENKQS